MTAPALMPSAQLVAALHDRSRVAGLTHGFYKYPARFSPLFARAAIEEFTQPGDLVVDPFMGGGTTAVEALVLGRKIVGTDTSRLAHFVANAKTTPLPESELTEVVQVLKEFTETWTIHSPVESDTHWEESGYLRNIGGRDLWRLRKSITAAIDASESLRTRRQRRFARAVVLRTAQLSIDTRRRFPSLDRFRNALVENSMLMASALREFAQLCQLARNESPSTGRQKLLLRRPATALEELGEPLSHPRLILTSPPYPGVHVLYHRWQVNGGRETPAPFWIAGVQDGDPSAHYTLAGRADIDGYFEQLETIFRSLRRICGRETTLVQLVGFRSLDDQLPLYMETMERAGFTQSLAPSVPDDLVRLVPNRRWYNNKQGIDSSSKEVMLVHRIS